MHTDFIFPNLLSYAAFVIDRYRPLLAVSIGTLIVNIFLNLLIIPAYGLNGAAAVLVGTEGLSLIATYVVFRHLTAMHVRWIWLWRPLVASCTTFVLAIAQGPVWSHQNRFTALLTGSCVIAVFYAAVLYVIKGMPEELRRKRPRHHLHGWFT